MSQNPAMYENPSAGEFEPVEPDSRARESRLHGRRRFAAIVALAVLAAEWLLPAARGWGLPLLAAAGFTASILEWVLFNKDLDETGPYSEETHITR